MATAGLWLAGKPYLSIAFVVLAFVGCQALLNAPKNHTGGDDALLSPFAASR